MSLTELRPGHFEAVTYVRDATGRSREVSRVSPPKLDSVGRPVLDRNGSRARDAVLAAAGALRGASRRDGELTGATRVRRLWAKYRAHLVKLDRASGTFDLYDRFAAMFVEAYGDRQLVEVQTDAIEDFLNGVGENHGRASMLSARSMLSGMFRFATRKGALLANPVREVELPENVAAKGRTGGARQITVEELRHILWAVRSSELPCPRKLSRKERERGTPVNSYRPPTVAEYCENADLADLVTLAAAAGKRPSQLLGLHWEDIDYVGDNPRGEKTLCTPGKVVRKKGIGLVREERENDPKNKGGTIALAPFAVVMLERRRAMLEARTLVDPPPEGTADMVFPSAKWTYRDPNNVQHEWQRVREALGLPDDVTLYSSRKAVATIGHDAGLSDRVVADVLDNSPDVAMNHYVARNRAHTAMADALEAALGNGTPIPPPPS